MLHIDNHYVLTYDKNNKKDIPELLTEYGELYAKVYVTNEAENNKKLLMFYNTYRTVNGIKLIK